MSRRFGVIGGGILGAAVASRLLDVRPDASVVLLEKEGELATHQTGRNSGVVHAGLYYPPGSLKAQLCREGAALLREFCEEHHIAYQQVGKVLVATDADERSRLESIHHRAIANGVPGIQILDRIGLAEVEPLVSGVAALRSPTTAIVDFPSVTRHLARSVSARGGVIRTHAEVVRMTPTPGHVEVSVASPGIKDPETLVFDLVVICAGLHADRLAREVGGSPAPRIMPFRGEYLRLREERRQVVRGLVYPVPDPRYPFLGVHLTPQVDGEVLVGPNAVLALAREGYNWWTVSPQDLRETLAWPGFVHFARRNWRTGLAEIHGSLSRRRFVEAARRYVPELAPDDFLPGMISGIRAQAMDLDGSLVDDFRIELLGPVLALRNAPSPAATSALAIARYLVDQILPAGRQA